MFQWTELLVVTHKALLQRKVRSVQYCIHVLREKATTLHQTDTNGSGLVDSHQVTQNDETGGHGPLYDGLSESDITHLRDIQDMVRAKGGETNQRHQMYLEIENMVQSYDHPLVKQVPEILKVSRTQSHHCTDKSTALFSITVSLATFFSHEILLASSDLMMDVGHCPFGSLDPPAV